MTKKTKNCFIDTDIVQKLGGFKGEKLLRKVLYSFGYNLYIHEYLVNEELIFGEKALEQLRKMINNKEIIVMDVGNLSNDKLNEYLSASQLLAYEMGVDLEKKRERNAGEVKSMAIVFVKKFEYFISDDRGARVAAKKHLQKLDGSYL